MLIHWGRRGHTQAHVRRDDEAPWLSHMKDSHGNRRYRVYRQAQEAQPKRRRVRCRVLRVRLRAAPRYSAACCC